MRRTEILKQVFRFSILWVIVQESVAFSGQDHRGFTGCDLINWRKPEREASVIGIHKDAIERVGSTLKIHLQNHKIIEFKDVGEADPSGAATQNYRVIDVGPHEEWIAIFETGADLFGYRIVFRGSGENLELGGCPIWSPEGHHFVALHEDLESGFTKNEASIWYCKSPSLRCERIWSEPFGGVQAKWAKNSRHLELVLSKLDPSRKEFPELRKLVTCTVNNHKTACKDIKPWSERRP